MSPEEELRSPPLGFSSTRNDGSLSCGDLSCSHEPGRWSRAHGSVHTRTPETDINCREDFADGRSPFLRTLIDAEAAANAAAIQLVSFKDAMEEDFSDSRHSATEKRRLARQRGLLLEKLEDFKRINKSVRQKLKLLSDSEAYRTEANHRIDILTSKIKQADSENENLKRGLNEMERRVEELMDLRKEEQENIKSAVHLTKSVEATRAHLQGQLRNKEAENNRLNIKIKTLERTLAEQKMQIDDLKASNSSLTEKAAQDKESFKKAARAQKLRAERFEAAIEKCYAQLKEKEARLTNVRLERDSKRRQKEQVTEEKKQLVAHVESLKSQIEDLTARLQEERDRFAAASDTAKQSVEKLRAENAALKESVAQLEQQLLDCESALVEETVVCQENKHQTEQQQLQVAELQAEVDDLRIKYVNLLSETEKTRDGKDAEIETVRQELQDALRSYPALLSAAEQSLSECQENLRRSERSCSDKSESIRQLEVKVESQARLLRSSADMNDSTSESNLNLQENVNSLHRQMDKLQEQNLELVRTLAAQEEALGYSNRQLNQRSSECQALSRQLEAAIADVKQQVQEEEAMEEGAQVNKVKDQAASRQEALQTKILELEAEKSRRDADLRLLRQSKLTAEKQFEMRLKDLKLSLDQSESHKQSIQNYVDFLRNSYATMFDEGVQTSLASSRFLK